MNRPAQPVRPEPGTAGAAQDAGRAAHAAKAPLLSAAALVAWFGLTHVAVVTGHAWVASIAVLGLVAVLAIRHHGGIARARLALGGAALVGTIAVIVAVSGVDPAQLVRSAVYLPSIIIPLTVMLLLGRSLSGARTPLVTALATMVRGPLDARTARYTRGVTWLWAAVMALLALECAALALLAPIETWSLFANAINHAVIGAVFVLEYLLRRRWLSQLHHPGFGEFVTRLRTANVRAALQR